MGQGRIVLECLGYANHSVRDPTAEHVDLSPHPIPPLSQTSLRDSPKFQVKSGQPFLILLVHPWLDPYPDHGWIWITQPEGSGAHIPWPQQDHLCSFVQGLPVGIGVGTQLLDMFIFFLGWFHLKGEKTQSVG